MSLTQVQPTCTDTDDGSVTLIFNRNLISGEQLRYTLLDASTDTPTAYSGDLIIGADKTFNISNLRAGIYTLQLVGFKDGLNTSTEPSDLFALTTFTIKTPPPLDFTLTETDVKCNGANDGSILISPTGGTRDVTGYDYYSLDNGANWTSFPNNAPYLLKGLGPGTYKIKVKDMRGCVAREQVLVNEKIELRDEIVREKEISQPNPLEVNYNQALHPTFFGAMNGKLVAVVSGGTIDGNQYWYQW
jgi:hypothetical protein